MLLVTPVFKSRRYIKERDGAIGRVKRGDEKVAKRDGKKIIRITSNKSGEDGAIELANNEYIYIYVYVRRCPRARHPYFIIPVFSFQLLAINIRIMF